MCAASVNNQTTISFEEVYDIVKRNEIAHEDLVYRTLLSKPEYLSEIPNNESYAILHYLVSNGALDLFNKVIAIPNIRIILLMRTVKKPQKDILQISEDNKSKSATHKKLYERIDGLVLMDKFAEFGKINDIKECKKMLEQDPDLVNQKPPYRKYYLIHHLAYANNRNAFDQLRNVCTFDMKLLTSDQKTASEVAFEQHHDSFAKYLETLSPEMRALREQHQKTKQKENLTQMKNDEKLEKQIVSAGGSNMLDCFTCPLTRELFQDPVILCDGFTYERSAIQKWLDLGNRRSPMTNIQLANIDLVPNMVIKQALSEISQKQNK